MPVIMFGLYRYNYLFNLQFPEPDDTFNALNTCLLFLAVLMLPDFFIKKEYKRNSCISFLKYMADMCLLFAPMNGVLALQAAIHENNLEKENLEKSNLENDNPENDYPKLECLLVFYWFYMILSFGFIYHYVTMHRNSTKRDYQFGVTDVYFYCCCSCIDYDYVDNINIVDDEKG